MARFVPRTLRGQRSESGADESAATDQAAVEETASGGTAAAGPDDAGEQDERGKARRPSPRRRTSRAGGRAAETTTDDADTDPAEAPATTSLEKASPDQAEAVDAEEATDRTEVDEAEDASVDVAKPRRPATSSARGRAGDQGRTKKTDSESGRTRAGGRKVVAPRTGSNRRAKLAQAEIGRLRRTAVSLVVWLVVFGVLAGVAAYFHYQGEATDDAARDATSAARSAAEAIFSYDYRSFDESVANGRQHVTGKFKDEYAKTTAGLAKTAAKEKAIMRARVATAGVVEASPERVDVLLFVNQYRRNANITGEKVDENRVVLTMVYVEDDDGKGDWLVSNAVAY